MPFGKLADLRKKDEISIKKEECEHVVIGNDIFAFSLFNKLKDQHGDNVKLITTVDVKYDSLRLFGPTSVRGEDNLKLFSKMYSDVKIDTTHNVSQFFKDQKWRKFGGRSKSEKILEGEEFYIAPRGQFEVEEIFDWLSDEEQFNRILNESNLYLPSEVNYNEKWEITFANGVQLTAGNLYWCLSPALLTDKMSDGDRKTEELIEFSDASRTLGSFFVKFVLPEQLSDDLETLFIPLSYTHDWGHFIGEFSGRESGQEVEFVTFVDPEQTSEEELSKRIKTLRRSLEKIYPSFKKMECLEFITFQHVSAATSFSDDTFAKVSDNLKGLHIVGENAPVDNVLIKSFEDENTQIDITKISHFMRACASLKKATI